MVKQLAQKYSPFKANRVGGASFTIGSESGDVINVVVQLEDGNGDALAERCAVTMYWSSSSTGDTIAVNPTSITIGTDGVIIQTHSVAQSFTAVSEADGDIDIDLEYTGLPYTYYLVVILPGGPLVISSAISFS